MEDRVEVPRAEEENSGEAGALYFIINKQTKALGEGFGPYSVVFRATPDYSSSLWI